MSAQATQATQDIQEIQDIPRFTYYNNYKSDDSKLFRIAFKLLFGAKNPEMPAEQVERHRKALLATDTVADDLVREVFDSMEPGQARKLFDKASKEGLESITEPLPPAFIKFFKDAETEPDWLDWDKLNLGVATCQRLGKLSHYGLSITALLQGYTNPDIVKPLIFTSGLTGDSVFNRITFTSAFWIAVTEHGALKPGAEGYETTLFVRLKHALVRRQILKNPDWKTELWGLPINQSDTAVTNFGFGGIMMLGAKALGMRISSEEEEGVMHFWRYIGYLMGEDDALIPKNIEETAQGIFFAACSNNNIPDADTLALKDGFLESLKQKGCGLKWEIQGFIKHFWYRVIAQYLIFPVNHKRLGLKSSYGLFLLVPLISLPLMYISETIRRTFPSLKPAFQRYGRWRQTSWLKQRFVISKSRPTTKGSIEEYVQ